MKAKKTNPKSIRFNKIDLEAAIEKSQLESPQELVDFLLNEYVKGHPLKKEIVAQPPVSNKIEDLKKIMNKPFQKDYFDSSKGIEGISNPNSYF